MAAWKPSNWRKINGNWVADDGRVVVPRAERRRLRRETTEATRVAAFQRRMATTVLPEAVDLADVQDRPGSIYDPDGGMVLN